MFDAHLHLQDQRILPYHSQFVKAALDAGVTTCISCASQPSEWDVEVNSSLKTFQSYGAHPWFAATLPPDWVEILETKLKQFPHALIGEIGLDGIRKTSDGLQTQHLVFQTQLALAIRYQRPVVIHGTRAWMQVFNCLETVISELPAVLLHGVNFAPTLLQHPLFKHSNIWMSIGSSVLTPTAKHLPVLAKLIPETRLLVETDSPDMFPIGGDPLVLGQYHTLYNHPGNLGYVIRKVAELRGVSTAHIIHQTEVNAYSFLQDC